MAEGGELKLWLTPRQRSAAEAAGEAVAGVEDGQQTVVVAPRAGRLVLFLSGAVDHAVLPCYAHRVALTAWFR